MTTEGVELWWLGQAGFRLRAVPGGPLVFCDPFLTVRDDRSWQAPVSPTDLARADLIVVSHEHTDHLDMPALKAAAAEPDARFTLILPQPLVADVAAQLDVPPERIVGVQPDEPIERRGIRIHPLPARHGLNVGDAYTFGQQLSGGLVRYLGYVIELGGVRIYHAGDCSPYDGQIERLAALAPQIALLPINGRDFFRESERNIVGNMDHREAARLASDIGVQVLVPMHWELFAHNRGYPHELVGYVTDHFPHLSVLVIGRGARHIFVPASPDAPSPTI